MKTAVAFVASVVTADAFVAPSSFAGHALARTPTASSATKMVATTDPAFATIDDLEKSVATVGGGFWFGSAGFWGEEDYRGFVDSYKPNNLINGVYPLIERVRETKILTTTSEAGLLSTLEDAGLTLSEAEKLLPALEEAGLLSFVADNGDVLINLFGFLAVEPAKLAIPVVVSLVKALKGVGLLKLGGGDAAPAMPSKPVPVKTAKSAAKAASVVARKSPVKLQPVMKAATPKVKAAAPKAALKPRVVVKKAAAKVVVAAKEADTQAKSVVKKAKPAVKKAVASATSTVRGNLANIPKAL